ncbi:hypothetical protein MTR67_006908 [Solanum verrucosum]|uniref:Gag-pol polyprotein n=1 Tax=Solanum verrucosum TaxID=315347 RepID=A0AAF0TEI3_SOLVR|nr:hypothetical protein MTR67_006908 [Solanum verrucosum]
MSPTDHRSYDGPSMGSVNRIIRGVRPSVELQSDLRNIGRPIGHPACPYKDMNTRSNPRRAKEENVDRGVPPQGLQGDQVLIGNQENEVSVVPPAMTNEEIRAAFLTLAQAMTAQANRDVEPRVNANESTTASRLRDFVRRNPPIFLGPRIGEDPQGFLNEIYKIVDAMEVFS